jgi:ABC-2 type transport system ATP-binding protein
MNLPLDGFDPTILLLVVPLLVLQLGLLIAAVVDLLRDDRHVRGGNKGIWAVIIVFVNLIGPILYFLVGRVDGPPEETSPGHGAAPGWGSPHDPPIVAGPEAGTAAPDGPATVAGTAVPGGTATPGGSAAPGGSAGLAPAPTARGAWSEPVSTRGPSPATAAGPDAIRIEDLTRRYPGGVLALDRLTMTVPEGSVFGLLGPNGAGKTTTLRLLAGLTRPTAGRAIVNGIEVAEDPLSVRRGLGYLEQDPRAYGWMTGREQVTMLGRLHGLREPELSTAVQAALNRVELGAVADRRAGTYSGGMRQRLGIAGTLVHRPPVIILDEPASSLDPGGRRDVLELIASLRGEATVLFSTHVLADVERICDRIAILDRGRLVIEGTLAELLDRYALPVYRIEAEPGQATALAELATRLQGADWVTGAAVEHGLLTVAVADPAVAARELLPALAAADLAVMSVARARPTLEDVFLQLTGDRPEAAA